MCTTLFSFKSNIEYPIIIASNRDEFYDRPTLNSNFWNDYPDVLGGIDLKALGTWLGITKNGKIAILTNYREPEKHKPNLKSRGLLLKKFLIEDISINSFNKKLLKENQKYNGYNIIYGNIQNMFYFSNKINKIIKLNSGIFGLSNALLNTPWPKVEKGKSKLDKEVSKKIPDINKIMSILKDNIIADDKNLPNTGIGLGHERLLSPIFIKSSKYGTRSSIVIMIDKNMNVTFIEDIYNHKNNTFKKREYTFKLKK